MSVRERVRHSSASRPDRGYSPTAAGKHELVALGVGAHGEVRWLAIFRLGLLGERATGGLHDTPMRQFTDLEDKFLEKWGLLGLG